MKWINSILDACIKVLDMGYTKLIRPVKEPASITSGYGWRILNGVKQFHDGIDYINSVRDRAVLAICDGVVEYDQDDYKHELRWKEDYHSAGNMLIVKYKIHGKDYFARYLHLKKNNVSKGETVKQGQVIGEYGDYGRSQGPHLHFDMYKTNWKKVNPTNIMLKGLNKLG